MTEPTPGTSSPTPDQVAARIRAVLGPGVRPAPRPPVPDAAQIAARIRDVLVKAPRPLPTAPGVLRSPLGRPAGTAGPAPDGVALAPRPAPRLPIPAWAAPAFPDLVAAATATAAPPPPRLGWASSPSRAAARLARAAPASLALVVRAYFARRRGRDLWVSLAFHAVLLSSLGFFQLAQHSEAIRGLFEPSTLAPPVHRVRLREADPPRIDLDRASRPPRAIDLWNTPYEGPGGADRPGATLGDHDESADGEDFRHLKGGLMATDGILGNERGWGGTATGPGATGVRAAAIGVGDGPGRPRPGLLGAGQGGGTRRGDGDSGGRRELVLRGGGSDETECAVGAGLRWLARHQAPDGSWNGHEFGDQCRSHLGGLGCDHGTGEQDDGTSTVALTALASMAFLDAGYEPGSRARYRDEVFLKDVNVGRVVAKGLGWLVSHQKEDGSFRTNTGSWAEAYGDAMATFALAEATAHTNAFAYRAAARRGLDFLGAAQNTDGGWRYGIRESLSDASITPWCLMAFRSATNAAFDMDRKVLEDARTFLQRCTTESGRTGYAGLQDSYAQGFPANTPSALICRLFVDHEVSEVYRDKVFGILARNLPEWTEKKAKTNFYYTYYGTLALYTADGPDGPAWRKWNDALGRMLLGHQRGPGEGCLAGSWDAKQDVWLGGCFGQHYGGRVCATALNVLSLEVYYRYAPLATVRRR